MHLPDGFLSLRVIIVTWLFSLGGLSYAFKKTEEVLKERMIPLMGVAAAFIFAAQMLNFPVIGGTSGHLLGGVLAAITLGPYPAVIVLSLVLIVQCLIFQDGGITSLGANIFNMAIIGSAFSYYIYTLSLKIFRKKFFAAVFISSWLSVVLTSAACAFELAFSRTSPFQVVFPAMVFVHIFIGIGEAVITAFVLSFILKVRPDLVYRIDG